jgi:hypothetical protein
MLVNNVNKGILKRIQKFQTERITRNGLKQLFYDNTYEPIKLWGETEGATPEHPRRKINGEEVYSIFGPRNQAPWNKMGTNSYIQGGYIILFSITEGGFRTYPFNKMERVEYRGTTYEII